ncbi:hypothetical protein BY996DRAFT_6413857 [Phakopsora pachyrhizi]|nr:hypothetical protein BY996DRAFT_6413857 [Phakopsora pachyrhizi]
MSQIVGSWSLRLPLLLLLCLSPEDCFMSWDGVHCIKSDQDKYRLIYKTNRLEEICFVSIIPTENVEGLKLLVVVVEKLVVMIPNDVKIIEFEMVLRISFKTVIYQTKIHRVLITVQKGCREDNDNDERGEYGWVIVWVLKIIVGIVCNVNDQCSDLVGINVKVTFDNT